MSPMQLFSLIVPDSTSSLDSIGVQRLWWISQILSLHLLGWDNLHLYHWLYFIWSFWHAASTRDREGGSNWVQTTYLTTTLTLEKLSANNPTAASGFNAVVNLHFFSCWQSTFSIWIQTWQAMWNMCLLVCTVCWCFAYLQHRSVKCAVFACQIEMEWKPHKSGTVVVCAGSLPFLYWPRDANFSTYIIRQTFKVSGRLVGIVRAAASSCCCSVFCIRAPFCDRFIISPFNFPSWAALGCTSLKGSSVVF